MYSSDRIERVRGSPICVRLHPECRNAIQCASILVDDIVEFGFAFHADQVYSPRCGFKKCVCDAMLVQTLLSQVGFAVMFAFAVIGLEPDDRRHERHQHQ